MVRAATDTCPKPFNLRFANAASKQKNIGPNKKGRGNDKALKTATPDAATTAVSS